MENSDKDNDSTYVPNEEGSEKGDDSIPSIDSLQEIPIHHDANYFEPITEITDTTNNANVDDVDNNVTMGENSPEYEVDDNTVTAGVTVPDEGEKDEDNNNDFTPGVIVQDEEEESSSEKEA
eukprot:10856310-Ditylum_brightwellii.AAC.1